MRKYSPIYYVVITTLLCILTLVNISFLKLIFADTFTNTQFSIFKKWLWKKFSQKSQLELILKRNASIFTILDSFLSKKWKWRCFFFLKNTTNLKYYKSLKRFKNFHRDWNYGLKAWSLFFAVIPVFQNMMILLYVILYNFKWRNFQA